MLIISVVWNKKKINKHKTKQQTDRKLNYFFHIWMVKSKIQFAGKYICRKTVDQYSNMFSSGFLTEWPPLGESF